MADVKITDLTAATAPDLDDLVEIVEDGASRKATTQQLLDAMFPAWTTPAFDAGNFTASGSMTWTVESGDVLTYAYQITGKTMRVTFFLFNTTVGGTPDGALYIQIPASKTSTKAMRAWCAVFDNGTKVQGYCAVLAGNTIIQVSRYDETNFSASTNATSVFGEIIFEIN